MTELSLCAAVMLVACVSQASCGWSTPRETAPARSRGPPFQAFRAPHSAAGSTGCSSFRSSLFAPGSRSGRSEFGLMSWVSILAKCLDLQSSLHLGCYRASYSKIASNSIDYLALPPNNELHHFANSHCIA
jgi:hypothetical protein